MPSLQELKDVACAAIDSAAGDLEKVSRELWQNPELAYEEHKAHTLLTDFLENHGFSMERKLVVDTAFRGTYESGAGPNVAVICEYDALPGIGHACGHNLIAEVGVGAGLGIQAAMKAADKPLGKLTMVGTPAEEGGAGKLHLIEAGIWKDVSAAMMAHPWSFTTPHLGFLCRFKVRALFKGRASHAAGFPWEGINALDAAVTAYQSLSCLRQQIKPTWRLHGIFLKGGEKPNIIPEEAELEYYIRTPTMGELDNLKAKVEACFRGAALTAGCQVEVTWDDKPYENLISNSKLVELYETNALHLGVEFCRDEAKMALSTGSTDMGNVSHVVPSIHPMFYIGADVMNHTRDFTAVADDQKAQPYTLDQAKALAMTALDVLYQPDLLKPINEGFQEDLRKDAQS